MRDGDESGKAHQPQVAAPAGLSRRADQPGSLAVVLQGRWRQPLPHRRHLVADRDRRPSDHAAARRDRPETGFGAHALLWHQACACRCRRARCWMEPQAAIWCIRTAGPARCGLGLGRPRPLHRQPISPLSGQYFTGDGCVRDADGYYWITGRVDDVINVSGHRMGTAEVESALVAHAKVAEAAVVGYSA